MHVSNLFYTEPMARLAERLWPSRASAAASSSPTPAPRRTSARSRSPASTRTGAGSPRRRSSASRATSTAAATAPSRRRPKLAANAALGPMLPGFRAVPRNDAGALREAVGENTAAVLIEPIQGEAGIVPDLRRGAARGPPGLRRGRRAADLRRDPDRGGADRLALGLPADPGPARRPDQRQGARRRHADRRLHHRPGGGRRARARRPRLDLRRRAGGHRGGAGGARHRSTTRPCCAGYASAGRSCARACWRSTASPRCAAAA